MEVRCRKAAELRQGLLVSSQIGPNGPSAQRHAAVDSIAVTEASQRRHLVVVLAKRKLRTCVNAGEKIVQVLRPLIVSSAIGKTGAPAASAVDNASVSEASRRILSTAAKTASQKLKRRPRDVPENARFRHIAPGLVGKIGANAQLNAGRQSGVEGDI